MKKVFVDADILIWQLRGHVKATECLARLAQDADSVLCVGALQRGEVLFGMRPGEENETLELLRLFETVPVTEAVVDLGVELYNRWNPSHGTGRLDALLAATVLLEGGKLVTQNVRHFPMPEIEVEQGWE